jgi:hypothetical protein
MRAFLLALLATLSFSAPTAVQTPAASTAASAPAPDSPTLASARARWERFTPEQKERARARYERFLAMSEEEREQLVESARRLREREDRLLTELEAKNDPRLASLDVEKRRALVREIVADESRAVGARIRGELPENLLQRLDTAEPEERARFFREFRIQQRDRVARYAIGVLGKELALEESEIHRLQALPGPERCAAVLDLRKRLSEKDVRISGLPPGITQEQWDAWLELPPEEFFGVLQRYRESRIAEHDRIEGRIEGRREGLAALAEAARPRADDVLALADLAPAERFARIQAQRRERCTSVLEGGKLVAADELAALEKLSDADFFRSVRRLLWKPSRISALRALPGYRPR